MAVWEGPVTDPYELKYPPEVVDVHRQRQRRYAAERRARARAERAAAASPSVMCDGSEAVVLLWLMRLAVAPDGVELIRQNVEILEILLGGQAFEGEP